MKNNVTSALYFLSIYDHWPSIVDTQYAIDFLMLKIKHLRFNGEEPRAGEIKNPTCFPCQSLNIKTNTEAALKNPILETQQLICTESTPAPIWRLRD